METDVRADIEQLFGRLLAAWTANDAEAYGACFTEDCDYVSYDGTRAANRAAMVAAHDELFRGVLRGSALVGEMESVELIARNVALAFANGSVLMPWRRELPSRRLSRQTLVVVHTDHGWRFRALHNGRVRPVKIPAPGSMPARGANLTAWIALRAGIGRRN